MVIGLLTLAAIPSVTAVSLGISERSKPETAARERARLRKFTLTAWCAGRSRGKAAVHGGEVVLGEGKMWIQSRRGNGTGGDGGEGGEKGKGRGGAASASASASSAGGSQAQQHPADADAAPMHAFDGFYLDYPDEQRPPPAPTGLVTMVSQAPPTMNWIYVDAETGEVRHGNRTQSRRHVVGDFGWTGEDEEGGLEDDADPGGLTLDGDELFVAVQPADGSRDARDGRWQVFWDREDDRLAGRARTQRRLQGRLVLRISLERSFVEEAGSLQE